MREELLEYVIDRAAEGMPVSPRTASDATGRLEKLREYVEWMAEKGYSLYDREKAKVVRDLVWPVVEDKEGSQ